MCACVKNILFRLMPIVIHLKVARSISDLPRFDIHARRQVENRHRSHAFNGRRRDQNRQTGTSTRLSAALRPCPATYISHANANASNTPAVYQCSPTSSATHVCTSPARSTGSTASCTVEDPPWMSFVMVMMMRPEIQSHEIRLSSAQTDAGHVLK